MASFSGDLVDFLLPFVGGIGESIRAVGALTKVDDVVDGVSDLSKAVQNASDWTTISTGRTTANNLIEKLAMESAQSDPSKGNMILNKLKDTRFPADFSKYAQSFDTSIGKIEIHYVGNVAKNIFGDFKFKN